MGKCLGHFALSQYLAHDLPPRERQQISAHLSECERCARLLQQIEQDRAAYAELGQEHYNTAWQHAVSTGFTGPQQQRRRLWLFRPVVYIKDRTKGGMVVDLFGLDAFLPGSQLDIKPVQDYDQYVGTTMDLKVVKLNPVFRNIVVSHKAIIEQDIQQQRSKILSKLEKGQVLEGTVKNITSYGVFIDLGGVDGLIHITDLSWGRINHPEEIVELDQKIKVVILDFDDEKKRIALGLKQLLPQPWESLDENLKIGYKVTGKVVVIADYGAFIEIAGQADGRLWSWEGCSDNSGCCHGSCTHVWNYAQAIAHLFPSLERTLRETEFGPSQDARGHQQFRSALPIRPVAHDFHAAADGQLGGIMKVFREWRISGDTAWLKALWPKVRASLDYCIDVWDPEGRGWVEEPHHNTYDIEFWGPDGICTSFYLGALKAAVAMGTARSPRIGPAGPRASRMRPRALESAPQKVGGQR